MAETDVITQEEVGKLLKTQMDIVLSNIRKVMKEKNISQVELGIRIDKTKQYVNYLLQHPAPNPKTDLLVRISDKIGVPLAELFQIK